MNLEIYIVVALTFVGFVALAFVLLFPVYRFLNREEKASQSWTDEAIARRQARSGRGDGATTPPKPPPSDA